MGEILAISAAGSSRDLKKGNSMHVKSLTTWALAWMIAVSACSHDIQAARNSYLKSGNEYLAAGKPHEAIVQYRNAVQQDPRFGEARLKLSEAYEKVGDVQNAYAEAIRAADLLPDRVDAQVRAGNLLISAGQFEDAKMRAQKALAIDPRNPKALVIRGYSVAGLKDLPAGIKDMEQAIQLAPDDPTTYRKLAQLQVASGKREEAEATIKKAVSLAPHSVDARLALAGFYWATDRRPLAEGELKAAVEAGPKSTDAHQALAIFYLASQRPAEAEPHLKWIAGSSDDPAAQLRLADYYIGLKRTPEAETILKKLLSRTESYADAQSRLAAIWFAQGNKAGAYQAIDDALKRVPNSSRALLIKSGFLLTDQKMDEAMKLTTAAVAADPQNPMAHFALAGLYVRKKEFDNAIKEYHEVLQLNPQAAAAQVQVARLEMARGRVGNSVQAAESALKAQPENADAQLMLARGLMARGELDRAESLLKELALKYPNSADVETQRGYLLGLRRDRAGARRAFDRALELDPDSVEALTGMLTLDAAEGKTLQARTRLESRLAQKPNEPALLVLAARTYFTAGDAAKAEQSLRKVIEIDPSNLQAYGMLGQLYVQQRNVDGAIAQFSAVAKRDPKSIGAQTAIGILLEMQNKPAEAQKQYESVLAIDPRAAVAANNLAFNYVERGVNLDVALRLAQTAKEQLPESPEISDTLGYVYLKKDLGTLAIDPFRMSVQKEPQNPIYHYHLGLAYAKAGQKASAIQEFEQALKLQPDFTGADDAKRQLQALR